MTKLSSRYMGFHNTDLVLDAPIFSSMIENEWAQTFVSQHLTHVYKRLLLVSKPKLNGYIRFYYYLKSTGRDPFDLEPLSKLDLSTMMGAAEHFALELADKHERWADYDSQRVVNNYKSWLERCYEQFKQVSAQVTKASKQYNSKSEGWRDELLSKHEGLAIAPGNIRLIPIEYYFADKLHSSE